MHWSDLRPPATLDVFGKSVEIYDADPFTKRFFALQTGQPVDYQKPPSKPPTPPMMEVRVRPFRVWLDRIKIPLN